MTAVRSAELPQDSLLRPRLSGRDFLDCYVVEADMPARRAAEVITAFPGWVRALLALRYAVTAPFGLKQEGPATADRVGIFPVDQETERELTAGFDDRHLNFRVSVYSDQGRVFLATWVRPHNFGGRLYLSAIMPFHVIISRNGLARVRAEARRAATGR